MELSILTLALSPFLSTCVGCNWEVGGGRSGIWVNRLHLTSILQLNSDSIFVHTFFQEVLHVVGSCQES